MSFPSHLFLPLSGAVVLTAAVLGTWLWPEPVVPPLKWEPPPVAAPVFVPPPPPAPAPRPVRPVARAVPPAPPVRPVEPPRPVPVAPPPEPVQVAVAPSYPPPPAPGEPATGQPSAPRTRLSMMGHAASVLERGILHIEKSRDEALARGDQAEAERLNKLIDKHRSRLAHLQRKPPQAQATDGGEPPRL